MNKSNFVKCMAGEYSIKNGVFKYSGNNTAIVIPDGVTEIKNSSWKNSVKAIYVGKNVTTISTNKVEWFEVDKENPFFSSVDGILYNKDMNGILKYPALKKEDVFYVPSQITFIGEGAFEKSKLKKIVLHDGINTIGKKAFGYMKNLTEISLPFGITTICDYAFCSSGLKSIDLPSSIVRIEDSAFIYTKLESFCMPETVEYLGSNAFMNCYDLKRIILSPKLDIIPHNCFYGCKQLNDVVIPETVQQIGESAFIYCESLTNIQLPKNLMIIGDGAFRYTGIEKIIVPDSVRECGTIFEDIKEVIKKNMSDAQKVLKQKAEHKRAEIEASRVKTKERLAKIESELEEIEEKINEIEEKGGIYTFAQNAIHLVEMREKNKDDLKKLFTRKNYSAYNKVLLEVNEIPNIAVESYNCCGKNMKLYKRNGLDGTFAIEVEGIAYLINIFSSNLRDYNNISTDTSQLDKAILTCIAGGAFLGYVATSAAQIYTTIDKKIVFYDTSTNKDIITLNFGDRYKTSSSDAEIILSQISHFTQSIALCYKENITNDECAAHSYIVSNKEEILHLIEKKKDRLAEKERKAQEAAKKRFDEYWIEHKDEKLSLQSEMESLKEQMISINAEYDTQKDKFSKELEDLSKNEEIDIINEQIKNINEKKDSLSIFKGKEKKKLQEKIDDLNAEKEMIESKRDKAKLEIEHNIRTLKAKTEKKKYFLQCRMSKIQQELTKER